MVASSATGGSRLLRPVRGPAPDDLIAGPAWGRHPTDVVRLILSLIVLAASVGLSMRHPAQARSVAVDLVELVNQLPGWIRDLILGTTQLLALAVPVALAFVLGRRARLLWTATLSACAAGLLMAALQASLDEVVPSRVLLLAERPSWVTGAAFPSGAYLAGLTAAIVVAGPVLSRGWRQVSVAGLAIAVMSRIVTAVAVPLNLAVTLALGAAIGSLALVLLGSPRRRASRQAVLTGLATAGFPAETIEPWEAKGTHARLFRATTAGGRVAFVKLLGRDERDADLILRVVRQLRVKDLDDVRPGWSSERLAAHESYSGLLLARRGVSLAEVLAAGTTADGDGLVALAPVEGTRFDQLEAEALTDDVLDEVWRQVNLIHDQGIAHRWLTTHHLMLGPGGTVTVIDMRWAAHQAHPDQMAADVAALVTSLALVVGAERSVAAADRALGRLDLEAALPLVQPLAMPSDVRVAIGGQDHVLPAVRDRIQAAAGDAEYQLADIERIGLRHLASLFGGVVAIYTVLAFASSWSAIRAAITDLPPEAVPTLVLLAAVPYVAGAGTLVSVVPQRLPFVEVVKLMLAQSFLNRFTPANAGGMALRVRYLQQRGADLGGAATGVALTSVASGICQAAVILLFAVWTGSSTDGLNYRAPQASTVAVVLLVISVAAGLIWLTPWGRRKVASRIETTVKQVWGTLRSLARQPGRFVTLFSTTLISKIATIGAFTESCRAMEIGVAFPRLGLLYLTASSVASAAPTPGGVGAVEAALTAALTGAGVPAAEALSAVFLFRLVTYWLPVPFGWWSLHRLQRTVLE